MNVGVGLQGANRELDLLAGYGIHDFLLLSEGVIYGDLERLCRNPNSRIALRFYHPHRMEIDAPHRTALADYQWLLSHTTPEQRQHIIAVIPANELNLDSEHLTSPYPGYWKSYQAYATINSWLSEWATAWRWASVGGWQTQLWWPALAPGHNPPGTVPESEYELLTGSMADYDAICVHVYGPLSDEWTGSKRLEKIVAKLEEVLG